MKTRVIRLSALAVASLLIVTACSSKSASDSAKPTSTTHSSTSQPSTDASKNQKQNQTTSNTANQSQTTETKGAQVESKHRMLINESLKLAKQGTVLDSEFSTDKNLIDQVIKKYGKPDRKNFVGNGEYYTYSKRYLTFGFNKGKQIFDVRTYDQKIKQLKLSEVKQALGKPKTIHHLKGQHILVYQANSKFQLKFVFPIPSKKNPDPKLDHISVFCPQLAKNIKAE